MAKIKIDDQLYATVKQLALKAGYTGADEFVSHLLEREVLQKVNHEPEDQEVLERLKGLGYIS